jgi:hypothetical protein
VELVKHQNLRYSKLARDIRTKQNEKLITHEDVMKLDIFSDDKAFQKKGIGYSNN